eukprot:UN25993
MTNDIRIIGLSNTGMYSSFLNSKGRYLHDFFITKGDDQYLLDCSSDDKQKLIKWLTRYKLRKKVEITDLSDQYRVWSVMTDNR